jgi:hypothetical protein
MPKLRSNLSFNESMPPIDVFFDQLDFATMLALFSIAPG